MAMWLECISGSESANASKLDRPPFLFCMGQVDIGHDYLSVNPILPVSYLAMKYASVQE